MGSGKIVRNMENKVMGSHALKPSCRLCIEFIVNVGYRVSLPASYVACPKVCDYKAERQRQYFISDGAGQ
jgi:hypothetical protein